MTDTTGSHESLRDIIRAYRKRAGLTQAEVASLAGLSVAGVRDIEQGRVVAPRADTIRQLGAALGLPAAVTARLAPRPLAGDSAANLWIGVLGPLTVRVDGVEVDPGSDLQRALLGLLALSPNLTVGRERLLSLVAAADRPATVAALAARISDAAAFGPPRWPTLKARSSHATVVTGWSSATTRSTCSSFVPWCGKHGGWWLRQTCPRRGGSTAERSTCGGTSRWQACRCSRTIPQW